MTTSSRFIEFSKDELERSVPERFEQQASLYAHRTAVKTKGRQITYRELNESANQIARILCRRSSPERPVALLLDHDFPAVTSILGVLKSGRSFVPLDPSLPSARLNYMLEDSGAGVIVTNNQRVALANELFRSSTINIDQIEIAETGNLELSISPGSMSCILYTSGITGLPKGVVHTHRNELHNVMHHTNTLSIGANDRLTLLGSYSTGQGMQDLYCALLNGATVYPWNLKVEGLSRLADWLIKEKVTIYHSAATVFRSWIRTFTGQEEFPDLRILRLGSEHVFWKDVEAYKRHFSAKCVFINALSSSETKTICQYLVNKKTHITARVPVGYAVAGTEISVVDEHGNPLEPGSAGEIAVRSRFISPLYWRDANSANTAQVPNLSNPEKRLFRTGEWGRMSVDGCLEHLGRRDAQVKIRGYRIEIFEAEIAILSHPSVDEVIVLCRENKRGDKYLVAYIRANGSLVPTVDELRTFLRRKIPEYMIPSAFVFLKSFPLTHNGKVNRDALPSPDSARPLLGNAFVAPTSPVEFALAEISTEVLGIDEIGIHDNHFDLGGNSLTAIQLVASVERQFGVMLSLQQFFDSPTIAALSRIIMATLGSTVPLDDLRIELAPRDDLLPLSFAQQRLWFLDQWEPGSPVYNICRAYRLRGKLEVRALQGSLSAILRRHEVLRTCFPAIDGQARQVIASFVPVSISIVNLSDLLQNRREEKSLQIAVADAEQPFDLAKGPVVRAKLVRLADDEHLFVLTVHQIACDGWSMHILERELWTIYDAVTKGISPTLPPLALQYADFATWQKQKMRDLAPQAQITYWKNRLHEPWPLLNLPTDRPRSGHQSFRGLRESFALTEVLTGRVKELARKEEVTVFMILITAFQILLHRYGNATDLLVGFPIANRRHRDTAGVVGFFVNTVVLRTDFSTSMSFRELLLKTRDACIGAYVHQDLPFDKLIEELRPRRDGSHNPVFQAMFVQQVAENSFVRVQDIVLEPVEIDTRTSKFDLTFSLGERHKRLAGFIEYSTDLFNRDTIERMAEHYQTILEAIVADRDQSIATLPILTKAERHRILVEWNDTAADYPKDKCIHQLFEEQVERTPEAIAVEFENQQITYGDLNRRANQLAHYLISLGIGPEKLVGICLERSIQMVVGLLAILKAGGAYVPLDSADPDERLRIMTETARVSLWLTEDIVARRRSTIEDGLPLFSILDPRLQVVCLDRDWQVINRQNDNNANVAVSSNNLAYVIFTSGSTGQPKGVQVSHRSVGNCLCAVRNQVPITNVDIWYALTTIAFDIAGLEFYLPLTMGARIILGTREESLDGKLMSLRLRQSGATVMQATPSTWRLLLEAGWEGSDGFRILCGGEAMPHDLAEALLVRGAVWNLYGPTESTIWSIVHKVESAERPVPIGRPLANTKIYILDCQLQPVPIGIHGDLYIGGDGLARGYWNTPGLTAEAFIPNPFSDDTSTRLYRTGDRARYRPDGVIEFLGRTDNQVKIRGYRIELGEIENTLNQYSSVKDSVVAYHERDSSEGNELIAYVVTGQLSAPSVSRLRRFLQKKLPEYMIPTSFVFLNALPITAYGKVDRNALPPPDGDRPRLDQRFVEPRTEIEELVAQIWREVLMLDNIGIHDNFFELGGHSLLAVRVVSRLREGFNVELPLRDFFQMSTVAELGHRIEISRQSSPMSLPSLRRVTREGPILPSIVQEPILKLARSFPGLNQFNIPSVYRLSGPLDVTALKASLTGVIERHEALRTIFLIENEKRYQSIDKSPSAYLDIIDLYELPATEREAEARGLYREESQRPFDLTLGPLFRVKLFRLSDDNHILAITVHHVVSDGWSMMVFVRDLAELYSASVNRSQPCLPDLPIQYADFAAWQQMVLQEGLLEGQLSYWKTQLSEPMTPLQFSTGISRTDEVSFFTGRKRISISGQLFHLIKSLARQERTTPFVLLLAALSILLSRHLDQEDIRVATLSANRNRSEVENVVGHFVNTLILRITVVKQFTFRELAKLVKDITVLAYSHQDLPFEALLQNLESETKIGFDALAPVLFTFSSELNTVEMTPLTISVADDFQSTEFGVTVTMFDLVLSLKERSEELTGFMIYKMFVFDEMMVERFIRNYKNLLETIVHDPNESVSDLCSSLEL